MISEIISPLARSGSALASVGAVTLATVLQRLRDLLKGSEPGPAGANQPASHTSRLSDRTPDGPRAIPPDLRKMDLLIAVGRRLVDTPLLPDLEPLLLPSLEVVCNAIGAERATIFIRHGEEAELMSYVGVGLDDSRPVLIPSTQGIAGECLRLGTLVVANDLTRDSRHYFAVDETTGYTTVNILAAPLKDSIGNFFGVFEIMNKPGGFTASDQAMILPFVSCLTDALFPHLDRLT